MALSKVKYLLIILSVFMAFSCQNNSKTSSPRFEALPYSLDFNALGNKIIELSRLQPGERVLLVMQPGGFNPIVDVIKNAIIAKGAEYLGAISVGDVQPDDWSTEFTTATVGKDSSQLAAIFQTVDLGIMLPGAIPNHLPYKVLQSILEQGSRRTIHFHWAGAYNLNGELLEIDGSKALLYQQAVLQTDYNDLGGIQYEFENEMRDNIVRVTTPEGTDLSFRIGDRPVTKQDGNASAQRASRARNLIDREIEMPSGVIRVAPLEETVNGIIAFPDADWDGQRVRDLIVSIENGKISGIETNGGTEAVISEIEKAGEAAISFREFALGFNPVISVQTDSIPWIPYYGYGAGVVRLSLGDNTELGGNVGGGYVRWNFFTNASVFVGDKTWVVDGFLVR